MANLQSVYSNVANVTVMDTPVTKPGGVTDIKAVNATTGQVVLSWVAPADIEGATVAKYEVGRIVDEAFVMDQEVVALTATIVVKPGTTVSDLAIVTVDSDGDKSDPVTVPAVHTRPSAPVITAESNAAGVAVITATVTVADGENANVDTVAVYRKDGDSYTPEAGAVIAGSAGSYTATISGLTPGATYDFVAVAVHSAGTLVE